MLNNITLVGRLTKNPELHTTNSGSSVCNFTLAVTDSYKNPDGTESVSFIPCVAFNGVADKMAKYLTKGSRVGLTGRINQRFYINDANQKVTVIEVLCDSVVFLDSKSQEKPEEKKEEKKVKKSSKKVSK